MNLCQKANNRYFSFVKCINLLQFFPQINYLDIFGFFYFCFFFKFSVIFISHRNSTIMSIIYYSFSHPKNVAQVTQWGLIMHGTETSAQPNDPSHFDLQQSEFGNEMDTNSLDFDAQTASGQWRNMQQVSAILIYLNFFTFLMKHSRQVIIYLNSFIGEILIIIPYLLFGRLAKVMSMFNVPQLQMIKPIRHVCNFHQINIA